MSHGRRGRLFVISGPSGVGKGSIVTGLLERDPSLVLSVSCTTRAPREGEVDGREYRFTTSEAFQAMVDAGELLEWAEVFGNHYGTPAVPIHAALDEGRDVLLEIDVQGARSVRERVGRDADLIFILPPSEDELHRRLLERGTDSPEVVSARLEGATAELADASWFDHRVVNDDLETAVGEVAAIIQARRDRADGRDSP